MGLKGFLGLGSNMGNREANLIRAIELISKKYPVLEYSSIYDTDPLGYLDQDNFLNMVLKFDTNDDDPFRILSFVKSIEKIMGRVDGPRWGPRLIDIDILYIDTVFIRTEVLNIPHVQLLNRDFVLIPMLELTDHLNINDELCILNDYIKHTDRVEIYKKRENIKIKVHL